jgi:hypothetical protein
MALRNRTLRELVEGVLARPMQHPRLTAARRHEADRMADHAAAPCHFMQPSFVPIKTDCYPHINMKRHKS